MRFMEHTDENVNPDFIPRNYLRPVRQVLPFYLASLVLVIGSLQLEGWLGTDAASLLAFVVITASAGWLYWKLQEGNDLIMANDFQNLLFAAASSLGSTFCFFLRRDGTIVFANDGTRRMFPKFAYEESRALDALLAEGQVSREDASQLYSSLTRGKKETLVFTLTNRDGEAQEFILIIDPLKRPSGYFVVHGRPYRRERQATVKLPGELGRTSPEKLEALLNVLDIGVYITNETGVIEYANPALEQLTRYEPHGLTGEAASIQSLIYHADGQETGEFDLADFSGNVLLSCKNGSLTQAFLQQHRFVDSEGRAPGFIGMLTPVG